VKLPELITLINEAYPDDCIQQYADGEDARDTLAKFIYLELKETFDTDTTTREQLETALRVMSRAVSEVQAVVDQLQQELDKNP